jgi:hypothetical protein
VRRLKRYFWTAAGFVCLIPLLPFFIVCAAANAVGRFTEWIVRGRRGSEWIMGAVDYCILQMEKNGG